MILSKLHWRPSPTHLHRPSSKRVLSSNGDSTIVAPVHPSLMKRNVLRSRVRATLPEAPIDQELVDVDVEEKAFQLDSDVWSLRGTCNQRLKFAVQYSLKRGTTDNSYLIKGLSRETTALIDVPYKEFSGDFLESLENLVGFENIGHIVMTHVDAKGIPTLEMLLDNIIESGRSQVDVHLSFPGLTFLRNIMGDTERGQHLLEACKFSIANPGTSLSLDDGKSLQFFKASTPRWPDMITVYYPSSKMVFSSKLFSSHVSPGIAGAVGAYDTDGWREYGNDWQHYFDCMLSPTATQVQKALKTLNLKVASDAEGANQIKSFGNSVMNLFNRAKPASSAVDPPRVVLCLCPMHGPIVKNAVHEVLEEYDGWLSNQNKILSRVAVFYASAYGHTLTMAQAISRGISKVGVGVDSVNLELADEGEVAKAISECSGFVIGSPTLGGHMPTQVQSALGTILREASAKQMPCGVFGSFGWSGEAVDEMNQRLKDAGFSFAFERLKVKFRPTAKDIQACEQSGTDLAQALIKEEQKKKKETAASSKVRGATEAAQALGRVVGTLCVVTAKDEEAECGMLASWISQASFDPPAVTVAVKKDRAVEDLMVAGNNFNVNILAQGRERPLTKAMLRPFKPGENRFADMEIQRSESTGCVIFPDAVSVLECTVVERMEAGDHWVVLGTIEYAKLLEKETPSAVHHRKVGTSY